MDLCQYPLRGILICRRPELQRSLLSTVKRDEGWSISEMISTLGHPCFRLFDERERMVGCTGIGLEPGGASI